MKRVSILNKLNLRDLRKAKKISQSELAEKLSIPVATIRKWEKTEALPSVQDMFSIAKVLDVQNDDIFKMFQIKQTQVEKDNLEEIKLYEAFEELFWGTDNVDKFIKFFNVLSHANINGTVYSEKYVFPYSKIIASSDGDGVIISDKYNNLMVFTVNNVKSIKPVSLNFDVYIFEITLSCSMFPVEDRGYPSNLCDSRIKISVYSR